MPVQIEGLVWFTMFISNLNYWYQILVYRLFNKIRLFQRILLYINFMSIKYGFHLGGVEDSLSLSLSLSLCTFKEMWRKLCSSGHIFLQFQERNFALYLTFPNSNVWSSDHSIDSCISSLHNIALLPVTNACKCICSYCSFR